MLLFLSISCEQEEIIDIGIESFLEQPKSSKSKNASKLTDQELIEQIEDLKNGTKRAYFKYNRKHPKQGFNKKFGKPIVKETKYIKFTDDDNITMIIPLVKKNNKKRKVLASYYKNEKKLYRIFTNKKYKRNNNESISERNLLNYLNLFLRKTQNKYYQSKSSNPEEYLYSSGCWDVYQVHESGVSYRSYRNTCTDEKGNGEDDEWDEPADPPTDDGTNDDDVNDYCDGSDPGCEGGGGGSSDSGGSDDGNNNSTSSYTLSEEPEFQYPINSTYATDYPKLTEYLKNKIPLIYDIPKIINAIHDITNLPYYEIEDDLQFDSGPIIEIIQLDDYAINTDENTVGLFDKSNPNNLFIDKDYILALENSNEDQLIQEGLLFYLGVVLLHEYVHYGDNTNAVQYQGEEGDEFELRVYGQNMTPSSAEWLILNKYY